MLTEINNEGKCAGSLKCMQSCTCTVWGISGRIKVSKMLANFCVFKQPLVVINKTGIIMLQRALGFMFKDILPKKTKKSK